MRFFESRPNDGKVRHILTLDPRAGGSQNMFVSCEQALKETGYSPLLAFLECSQSADSASLG